MQAPQGFELDSPPSDGISGMRFAGHADLLLVASWDAHVRLYDATLNTLRACFKQRAPVLDAAFLVLRLACLGSNTRKRAAECACVSAVCRTRMRPSAAAWTPRSACTTSTARWKRCALTRAPLA